MLGTPPWLCYGNSPHRRRRMAGNFLVRGVLHQGVGVRKYENMCEKQGDQDQEMQKQRMLELLATCMDAFSLGEDLRIQDHANVMFIHAESP